MTSSIRNTAVAAVLALALLAAVAWAIARQIVLPLRAAGDAMRRLAGGDLTRSLVVQGSDEIAQLGQDMQRLQAALAGMVVQLRQGIDAVSATSHSVAQGSSDLSQRTEAQAASLQQTAASMEPLGGTMASSASHAQQASTRVAGAAEVAQQGGRVMAEMVQTMREIESASGKIAEITGVIDAIAFQTNILALNAAVEAARAGDQGRGFAVVAAEVRTLAGRSAEAAREIKSLIGASTEKVAAGAALVQTAGQTMDDIVQGVERVTGLTGEISAATAEQTQGLSQISQAVSELDQTTQRNAALVEESASAAQVLREQAAELTTAVSAFRLRG